MRSRVEGWRSARGAAAHPRSEPVTLLPQDSALPVEDPRDADMALHAHRPSMGVEWSVLYVAFLAYIFAVVTYKLPIGGAAMALALAGLVLESGPLRCPPLLVWMGGYLLWSVLGYMQTAFPEVVLDQLLALGKLWLIALVAVNALTTRARIRFFIVFFLGCFALFPVRGALVNYVGGYTVFGRALWNYIYGNPNDLAALTLLQLSMAAGLLRANVRSWVRWASMAGVGILILVVVLTQSRGAFVALAAFVLLSLGATRRKLRSALIVAVVALALMIVAPAGVWDRVLGLRNATTLSQVENVDAEGSARQRLQIWKVAAKIISEHPVAGVGVGAYPPTHQRYARSSEFNRIARGARDPHSTLVQVAAESGIPGAILFIGMIVSLVRFAERQRKAAAVALPRTAQLLLFLEFGLFAFLIAGIWGSFAYMSFFSLHLVLIWAIADICRRDLQPLGMHPPPRGAWR